MGRITKLGAARMSTLELRKVSKSFGTTIAVDNVDLRIEDNEFFCIFGPPSCGKSTILRLLLGLLRPDHGQVLVGGIDMTATPPASRNLAMVFQNLALFPHLTARDNLAFPLVERGEAKELIDRQVTIIAEKLRIAALLHKLPGQLSGGERQRVAIGRALVRRPNAYLMDEPIAALDARLREEMRVELKRLQRDVGHTLVYVTHDQEEAMSIADRLAIIRDGRIAQIGTPDEIYNRPISRYVAELVGSPKINIVEGTVESGQFRARHLPLCVPLDSAIPEGEVMLGVRPEDIAVSAVGAGASSPYGVYEVEPLGAYSIVDIAIGDFILKAQVRGQPSLNHGQSVMVRIDPAHCIFFDAATGANLMRCPEF